MWYVWYEKKCERTRLQKESFEEVGTDHKWLGIGNSASLHRKYKIGERKLRAKIIVKRSASQNKRARRQNLNTRIESIKDNGHYQQGKGQKF